MRDTPMRSSRHFPDALRFAGLDRLPLRTAQYTFAEQVARFATSPAISGLLLMVGFLGITIEMLTLHGIIAGSIGVGSLALFFGTRLYSGFSNSLVIVLAILGVVGILLELHVIPGHFVAGVYRNDRAPGRGGAGLRLWVPLESRCSRSPLRRCSPR